MPRSYAYVVQWCSAWDRRESVFSMLLVGVRVRYVMYMHRRWRGDTRHIYFKLMDNAR